MLKEKHWLIVPVESTYNKVTIVTARNKDLLLHLVVVLMVSLKPQSTIDFFKASLIQLNVTIKIPVLKVG